VTVVKQASLASHLAGICGRKNVSPGSGVEAVDGIAPKTIVRPGSYDDVRELLAYANDARLAVIPLGGRLHAGLGNLPERYDLALDVKRLDQVAEFEAADLTITVQAGMTLGALRKLTASQRMMAPFDPELPDEATVGGVLAAGLSGAARFALGAPRDFTIGMRVVTADGRLTRAGGRVVKNVAGYDMCKLYIGSLGTIGVIVEATFKTIPLPRAEQSVVLGFPDAEGACALVSRATKAGLALRSAKLTRLDASWRLDIGLAGMEHAVMRSLRDLKQRADDPPPGDVPSEDAPLVCVIVSCPPGAKRDIDVFGEAPSSLQLMRAIKQEFDPHRVLSPGRMAGHI
jgi:FAD/FMN-containing dehydrogenase